MNKLRSVDVPIKYYTRLLQMFRDGEQGGRVHGLKEISKWDRTVTDHLHHVLLLQNIMTERIFQQLNRKAPQDK